MLKPSLTLICTRFNGVPRMTAPPSPTVSTGFLRPPAPVNTSGRGSASSHSLLPPTQLECNRFAGGQQLSSQCAVLHRPRNDHPANAKCRDSLGGLMITIAITPGVLIANLAAHAAFQEIHHRFEDRLECPFNRCLAAGHVAR